MLSAERALLAFQRSLEGDAREGDRVIQPHKKDRAPKLSRLHARRSSPGPRMMMMVVMMMMDDPLHVPRHALSCHPTVQKGEINAPPQR